MERFAFKLVKSELERAQKIEKKPRPDISQLVVDYELPTLRDVVNKILLLEKKFQRAHNALVIAEPRCTQAPPS